jgi:hypothetical protein
VIGVEFRPKLPHSQILGQLRRIAASFDGVSTDSISE